MRKKLAFCMFASVFTIAGGISLARPTSALAFEGCERGWWLACANIQARPGCYMAATCTVNPDGSSNITCAEMC
jgi:hypothetical protein